MNRIPKRQRHLHLVRSMTASLLLAALLWLPALTLFPTAAYAEEQDTGVAATETQVRTASSSAEARSSVSLTRGGKKLSVSARRYDGYIFVPLHDFAKQFTTVSYRYDAASQYATLTAASLNITAGRGATTLTANDRVLWGVAANRMVNGTMWVPLSPLAKALGLTVTQYTNSAAISGNYKALTPASQFYREDEVYWLSRIISAESRGEPLRGQIAVGNIILNRTRTYGFPNTIWGVIFEKDQFSPVKNGSVYNTPAWTSVVAAKICLEGYTIDKNILFFCNTTTSPVNWITQNRTVAFRIGAHTFYY